MAQDLTVNIKTTSDVPQAMDRAKSATDSFGKQVEGISKKFGSSFKDIFLSFLGPMALITGAFALISKLIADQQQKREDANRAAIEGTNALMSAEDRYYANKLNNEKKSKEQIEEAKVAREDVTQSFLENDPRGKAIMDEIKAAMPPGMAAGASGLARNTAQSKVMQDRVQAILAPEAAAAGPSVSDAANAINKGSTSFKGPEGFSNVIGIGSNPVMEAMTAQLEEQRKQTALLQQIASPNGSVPADFTKSTSPSRAALLRGAL
jgi:hypothetical protein